MNIPEGPILIVEDMPQIRSLLEVTLRFKGYPVESASNGLEALEEALTLGYAEFEFMEEDTDLDNIRNNPKYLEIVENAAPYASPPESLPDGAEDAAVELDGR